jgi:hypothetical protein
LEQAKHPLAAELGPYAGVRQADYLDPVRLADGFMTASADPSRLLALNKALLQLTLSARQMGREWQLKAVSMRVHIREKLRAAFGPAHGFAVEFAGPLSAREVVANDDTLLPDVRYTLRHAGRTVKRAEVPARDFGTPVETLEGVPTPPRVAEAGKILRETTVEVFVAKK